MLCATCLSIFTLETPTGRHHDTVDALVRAAQSYCRICMGLLKHLIQIGLDTKSKSALRLSLVYKVTPRSWPWGQAYCVGFEFGDDNEVALNYPQFPMRTPEDFIVLYRSPDVVTPSQYEQFIEAATEDLATVPWTVREDGFEDPSISTNTGSEDVARIGKSWLHTCLGSHRKCHRRANTVAQRQIARQLDTQNSEWQPKRLVDCRASTRSGMLSLVLRDRAKIHTPYATLSHCWGDDPSFFTLNETNLQDALNGKTSLSQLPRSFRDAVLTCRRLDIDYLWIDSICILQSGSGSERDWQEQSREMHLVYANCILNIAIEHATNPEQGAFMERETNWLQPCHVVWHNLKWYNRLAQRPNDNSDIDNIPDTPQVYTLFLPEEDFGRGLERSPLAKRGWVAQECFLSPRILRFTETRIYWQCYTKQCLSEYLARQHPSLSDSLDQLLVHESGRPFAFPPPFFSPGLSFSQDMSDMTSFWRSFVEDYTKRDLRFPAKDRLVAVSAIARRLSQVLPENPYTAGIFQSDLLSLEGLMWLSVFEDVETLEHAPLMPVHRPPSWSWASVDHSIRFSLPARVSSAPLLEILDYSVIPASGDPYGRLKSGSLKIKGVLMGTTQRLTFESRSSSNASSSSSLRGGRPEDASGTATGTETPPALFEVRAYRGGIRLDVPLPIQNPRPGACKDVSCILDGVPTDDVKSWWLLPVLDKFNGLYPYDSQKRYPGWYTEGLVLREAAESGSYTRVGYYHAWTCLRKEWELDPPEQRVITVV